MLWPYTKQEIKSVKDHWKSIGGKPKFIKLSADEQRLIAESFLKKG